MDLADAGTRVKFMIHDRDASELMTFGPNTRDDGL